MALGFIPRMRIPLSARLLVAFVLLATLTAPTRAQSPDEAPAPSCEALLEEAWAAVADGWLRHRGPDLYWSSPPAEGRAACRRGEAPIDAVRGALRLTGDPHVRLLSPGELAALMADLGGTAQSVTGLSELLALDRDERTGRLTVVTPDQGSPAARAGVRPGDRVVAIDGVATEGLLLEEAAAMVRGAPGTAVRLRLDRGADTVNVMVPREPGGAFPAARWTVKHMDGRRVGTLGIAHFRPGAAAAVLAALDALLAEAPDVLILDLRTNGGGQVDQLLAVAGAFLPEGALVARLAQRTDTVDLRATGPRRTELPLAVLVDGGTASAAEALAGGLQAAGRAVVVGERTFGKGLAHSGGPLSDGSFLMMPIGRLLTPTGRDILDEGIAPDVAVPLAGWPLLDEPAAWPNDAQHARAVALLGQAR